MIAKRFGRLAAVVVLLATGLYFFVYLWRWEWNRAAIAGILFIAVEVGIGTSVVIDRLRSLTAIRTDGGRTAASPEILARLRETAPPPRDHFAWLSPRNGQMGVFVPVLMGMGVVASGLAWVVERLGRATATPVLEKGLASRLAPLSWPATGLSRPEDDPLAILARPVPSAVRR